MATSWPIVGLFLSLSLTRASQVCEPIVCYPGRCKNGGICVDSYDENLNPKPECFCKPGFTGRDCSIDLPKYEISFSHKFTVTNMVLEGTMKADFTRVFSEITTEIFAGTSTSVFEIMPSRNKQVTRLYLRHLYYFMHRDLWRSRKIYQLDFYQTCRFPQNGFLPQNDQRVLSSRENMLGQS